MSDIYNIVTGIAELLLMGVILWQRWLINKLERDIDILICERLDDESNTYIGDPVRLD